MGYLALQVGRQDLALVDDEDVDACVRIRWQRHKSKTVTYAKAVYGGPDKICVLYLHRFIAGRVANIDGLFVDHVNGDGLDCRRENLRVCTAKQSVANRERSGAYWHSGRWQARIMVDGVVRQLGRFVERSQAEAAYAAAHVAAHGSFSFAVRPALVSRDGLRVVSCGTSPRDQWFACGGG